MWYSPSLWKTFVDFFLCGKNLGRSDSGSGRKNFGNILHQFKEEGEERERKRGRGHCFAGHRSFPLPTTTTTKVNKRKKKDFVDPGVGSPFI